MWHRFDPLSYSSKNEDAILATINFMDGNILKVTVIVRNIEADGEDSKRIENDDPETNLSCGQL